MENEFDDYFDLSDEPNPELVSANETIALFDTMTIVQQNVCLKYYGHKSRKSFLDELERVAKSRLPAHVGSFYRTIENMKLDINRYKNMD